MFLRRSFGVWPPRVPFEIVVTPERDRPGWDGKVRPIQGVLSPEGSVLAVSPRHEWLFEGVAPDQLLADVVTPDATNRLSRRLGVPVAVGVAALRWSERATQLPEVGEWVPADDPRLPDWLAPFHGSVLATFGEQGKFVAGVGVKHHGGTAEELAVGTDPAHRGRGYARMLVAQAARDIIARGCRAALPARGPQCRISTRRCRRRLSRSRLALDRARSRQRVTWYRHWISASQVEEWTSYPLGV